MKLAVGAVVVLALLAGATIQYVLSREPAMPVEYGAITSRERAPRAGVEARPGSDGVGFASSDDFSTRAAPDESSGIDDFAPPPTKAAAPKSYDRDPFVPDASGVYAVTLRQLGAWPLEIPHYDDPDMADKVNGQIPRDVMALDGKTVEVDGFVMPFTFDDSGAISRFLLVPHLGGCAFHGGDDAANEIVDVLLPEATKKLDGYRPHRVRGTLWVGMAYDPAGYPTGVFTLQAETVRGLRRGESRIGSDGRGQY